jgi:putative oxidoreductase
LSWDAILQRLFSTFPGGSPGVGLLLLRFCLGTVLICFGLSDISGKSSATIVSAQSLLACVGGIFLLAGLWTPVTCTFVVIDEAWSAFKGLQVVPQFWIHLFVAVLVLSIGLLGPGALSVDARLFGRKRFDLDRIRGRKRIPLKDEQHL